MVLLSGNNLKKMFADKTIFENASFNIYSSDKIGFIGVNGAGKSTLFKILIGNMDYDGGEIFKSKETNIGYLEQHTFPNGNLSIMDEMISVFSEVTEIEKQLEDIVTQFENPNNDMNALISRQAVLQERFIELDGMYYKEKIKSALMGLGFAESEFLTPICKLSGGQKTRVALCKILLSNANLLLLDEPTNHLDIDSIKWLEDFLINYKGAFVVISHDRYFLDKVTKKTFEIENKQFRSYDGNYSSYKAQREIEKLTKERNYNYTTREIERLKEVIEQQRRWKHKKNKKTHTLDNTRKAIERLEENLVEPDKDNETMHFKFKACDGGAKNVIMAKDLSIKFGENTLFENVNMLINKGEKVFLLGPNGCGKTSLIKILMGIYKQSYGEYKIGDNIYIGYYDQLKENLHKDKTVIEEIWDEYPNLTQTEIRNALALFLFKGDDVFKEINSLSGGEMARVELTKLLLNKVNLIIMDEPTNHLDIDSRESLETALTNYDGTMFIVSHDRYFINRIADRILYLTSNGIIEYEGNYDDFIESRQEIEIIEKTKKIEDKSKDYREQKQIKAEKQKRYNRLSKLEEFIEKNENQIKELSQKRDNPEIASDYEKLCELTNQINLLEQQFDEYMNEWENLQEIINENE